MENLNIKGVVTEISDIIPLKSNKGSNMNKKVISLQTANGNKLFIDLINSKIEEISKQEIENGSIVEISFRFNGSEKAGKKYNNIFCKNIKKIG